MEQIERRAQGKREEDTDVQLLSDMRKSPGTPKGKYGNGIIFAAGNFRKKVYSTIQVGVIFVSPAKHSDT